MGSIVKTLGSSLIGGFLSIGPLGKIMGGGGDKAVEAAATPAVTQAKKDRSAALEAGPLQPGDIQPGDSIFGN